MPEILALSQVAFTYRKIFISVLLKIRGLGAAVSYYALRLVRNIIECS